MLNFTPMVLLPPLLQQHAGFPDSLIGEVIAARGVGATLGFFLAIFVGRMDPRIGLIAGFLLQTLSGVWLMAIDLNVDMNTLMLNSLLQGVAVGVVGEEDGGEVGGDEPRQCRGLVDGAFREIGAFRHDGVL